MLSPKIKNQFSDHPQTIMRPVHLKLSEEIIAHLEHTMAEHGFNTIQGLIRFYIREGLHRDNCNYDFSEDVLFIEELKNKGVSQKIIDEALTSLNKKCEYPHHPH